jgi:Fe2+ transport system protein FeoA
MPGENTLPLAELRPPQQALVRRVDAGGADFLRYLEALGLVPGAHLEVLTYSPFDQNIRLCVNGNELVLGPAVTGRIFVEVVEV